MVVVAGSVWTTVGRDTVVTGLLTVDEAADAAVPVVEVVEVE